MPLSKQTEAALKKRLLNALKSNLGIISRACAEANISRSSYHRWMNSDPEFKAAAEEMELEEAHFVESQLVKLIEEKNVASIIFYLKNKGRKIGYGNVVKEEETNQHEVMIDELK